MIKIIPQSILLKQAKQEVERQLDEEYPDALQAMLKAIEACKRGEDVRGTDEDTYDSSDEKYQK